MAVLQVPGPDGGVGAVVVQRSGPQQHGVARGGGQCCAVGRVHDPAAADGVQQQPVLGAPGTTHAICAVLLELAGENPARPGSRDLDRRRLAGRSRIVHVPALRSPGP